MVCGRGEGDRLRRCVDGTTGRLYLGFEPFAKPYCLVDEFHKTGRVKIDIGEGGKNGAHGKAVHLGVFDAHLTAGVGNIG